MLIILWWIALVALTLWLAFVVALSAPPAGDTYVWTVAPGEVF